MPVSAPAYLAFDLGASSGRAIVGYMEDGRLELEAVHRFTTPILEHRERLYWDLDRLRAELNEGLVAARRFAPGLRSLSVDSWGVDYVPLDTSSRPVRPAYCYRDTRTDGLMETAFAYVSPAQIYAATGIQFMPINTIYQVFADVRDEPDLVPITENRLPIADYFNFLFSGKDVSEVSLASTTQLLRVGSLEWAHEIMRPLGIPVNGWPKIVPSGTVLGPTLGEAGVQVVASCSHDTGCAVAATPGKPGTSWAYISCGTWSLLGVELNRPVLSEEARRAGFTNEAGLDGTIRFLKNLTGLWALQECVREWEMEGPDVYEILLREARETDRPRGLVNLEDPRFLARGEMEGRIRSYCLEKGIEPPASRGGITRLILESIADSYARTLGDLEKLLGYRIDTVHLVGGGSQNELLCQLTADVCRRPVVAGPAEATAIGNLLIQLRALGDIPKGRTIRDVVASSFSPRTFVPNGAETN